MVYRDCTKGICNRIDKINIETAQECRNACDGLMSIDCQSWDWGEKSRNVTQKVEAKLSFLTPMKKLSQRIRGYFWVLLDYVE